MCRERWRVGLALLAGLCQSTSSQKSYDDGKHRNKYHHPKMRRGISAICSTIIGERTFSGNAMHASCGFPNRRTRAWHLSS